MNNAMVAALIERRMQLRALGYLPLPLFGKAPPLKTWQNYTVISRDMIEMWSKVWPDATNTGALTRFMPTLDLDILNEEAVRACEMLIEHYFEDRGRVLIRIGKPPKRAILFRTNAPFKKLTCNLIAPNGSAEKIEFLSAGQQVVVDGEHPETKRPYAWHGGVPWDIAHAELPNISAHEAAEWVNELAEVLVLQFNYRRASAPAPGNGGHGGGEENWKHHISNILHGRSLHDSIASIAAALAKTGMHPGTAVHFLQALVELSETSHDERWEARYRDIPRAIDTAYAKYSRH